jgi:hypothetical protein
MTKKILNNWFMYHAIHKYRFFGFSAARIARYLDMDARTVSKYLQMSEQDYELYLNLDGEREKVLSPYEGFVKEKLTQYPDTSSAQMYDWLLEHHSDLPTVSSRTVYNFVTFVRQKHNIPFVHIPREYFPVEELPYGEQAQVDFGEYNMRLSNGTRKKVRFFIMVLSRSRMKFIWFLDTPFTAKTVSQAHESAFAFFGGIPNTIVYDQDRTMLVDENIGDLILTSTFKQYVKSRTFKLHFCRKSDPESKGKVENAVGYVKKNFLYNRPYSDLESLNIEALGWLRRTANVLEHNFTKKSPQEEHWIEKTHLNPYTPLTIENKEIKMHHVRKTNTIAYKSNFYTVPMGTYQQPGTQVIVKENGIYLEIYDVKQELICTHELSTKKGQLISNTSHKRDTTKSLDEMIAATIDFFTEKNYASNYLKKIREDHPRYTRDHLQVILRALDADGVTKEIADDTLKFCVQNTLFNGNEFEEVLYVFLMETILPAKKQGRSANKQTGRL